MQIEFLKLAQGEYRVYLGSVCVAELCRYDTDWRLIGDRQPVGDRVVRIRDCWLPICSVAQAKRKVTGIVIQALVDAR